jgi:hypothetical protein
MSNNVVYGNKLIGTVTIRNNGKEHFNGNLKLQVWHQPKGDTYAWSSSSTGVEMSIAPAKTGVASFQFNNLIYDDTYHIAVYYTNQSGTLTSGGIWDHSWVPKAGILSWKSNGSIVAQPSKLSFIVPTTAIATYANNVRVSRMTANKNPNTIYYFAEDTSLPTGGNVLEANIVGGDHADIINLYSDYPFYIPGNFEADTVNFHYTFPSDLETKTVWQTVTLPFAADSIKRGDFTYQLNDSLNHFWIYEFSAIDDDCAPVFTPAKELRGNTPYLIACDSLFKGLTITFTGKNKPFFTTGSDKMIVSSITYNMYGTTYQPNLKDVYMLNAEGTAFEYVTKTTTLPALTSYFTSKLTEEESLEKIFLPFVPQSKSLSAGWGDINLDQKVDENDIEALANTLVLKAPEGICLEYGDVDGDGKITVADLVRLINQVIK